MIRIAVCDHEPVQLNAICGILSQYAKKHPDFYLSVSRTFSQSVKNKYLHFMLDRGKN